MVEGATVSVTPVIQLTPGQLQSLSQSATGPPLNVNHGWSICGYPGLAGYPPPSPAHCRRQQLRRELPPKPVRTAPPPVQRLRIRGCSLSAANRVEGTRWGHSVLPRRLTPPAAGAVSHASSRWSMRLPHHFDDEFYDSVE